MAYNLFDYRKLEAIKAVYPPRSLVRLEVNGELLRVVGYEGEFGEKVRLAKRSLPTDIKIIDAIRLDTCIGDVE